MKNNDSSNKSTNDATINNADKDVLALVNSEVTEGTCTPIEWEVGRHYRGSFWLNEFGEIQVKAEQKGSKPGNMKLVTKDDNHAIYASRKLVRIIITLPRLEPKPLRTLFAAIAPKVICSLMKYNFNQ